MREFQFTLVYHRIIISSTVDVNLEHIYHTNLALCSIVKMSSGCKRKRKNEFNVVMSIDNVRTAVSLMNVTFAQKNKAFSHQIHLYKLADSGLTEKQPWAEIYLSTAYVHPLRTQEKRIQRIHARIIG